ncbi:hypothetical protein MJD09_01450 [bacterium]|nr:hypothetical protein [bacterium]
MFFCSKDDLFRIASERENVKRNATFHQMFLIGAFLSFSILHFLLFYFYPRLRLNLYFAIMALFISLSTFLDFQRFFIASPKDFYWNEVLLNLTGILAVLACVRFIHALFNTRLQKTLIALVVAGLGVWLWSLIRPFSPPAIRDMLILLGFLEIARTLIQARLNISVKTVECHIGKALRLLRQSLYKTT